MKKKILLILFILFFSSINVSAGTNITLYEPEDSNNCVIPTNTRFNFYIDQNDNCILQTNYTGSWANTEYLGAVSKGYKIFYHNFTDSLIVKWRIHCNLGDSLNNTFTLTDKPYCAILSNTTCSREVHLEDTAIFSTRLSNTKGIYLENQDCNVWITDSTGILVKTYPSMMYNAEVSQALDEQGNIINLVHSDYPVTDSNGYYIFPFKVESQWAYYGDEYRMYVSCNGQITSCPFNVTKQKLPDMKNMQALGKEGSGVFIFLLVTLMILFYGIKKLWRMR